MVKVSVVRGVSSQKQQKVVCAYYEYFQNKLGLQGNDCVDAVNLKCSPMMIGTLIDGENIFPAYHMSKANWITVVLDENIEEDKIKMLLDISFEMTAVKIKSKRI